LEENGKKGVGKPIESTWPQIANVS